MSEDIRVSITREEIGPLQDSIYYLTPAFGPGSTDLPRIPLDLLDRWMGAFQALKDLTQELEPYYLQQRPVVEAAITDLLSEVRWRPGGVRFASPEVEEAFRALQQRHGRG